MKTIDLVQGTKPWHDYRQNRVGASDIPSIVKAKGRYKSRAAVMREKMGAVQAVSDFTQRIFDNGHAWEAKLKEHFTDIGTHFESCVIEHPENDRFFASLDGLSADNIILEVKTTSKVDIMEQLNNGEIPDVYNCQIQWQFYVSGLSEALLAVVHKGEVFTIPVYRDDEKIKEAEKLAQEFINELDEQKKSKEVV